MAQESEAKVSMWDDYPYQVLCKEYNSVRNQHKEARYLLRKYLREGSSPDLKQRTKKFMKKRPYIHKES